ncbi:hypothetical protein [Streptomyces sp. SID14478]|nr:hypothetical protein [Streptomyces sp. SID14478]
MRVIFVERLLATLVRHQPGMSCAPPQRRRGAPVFADHWQAVT